MGIPRLTAFKAYDIRGKIPTEINEDMAFDIGRAYSIEMKPRGTVAVGRDVCETSISLADAFMRGVIDSGIDAVDIGLCSTEMMYFASSLEGMGGGEMSAHHYFRDFSDSDSGMIPWLLVAKEMSTTGRKLSELVGARIQKFPCSGEINRTVVNPEAVLKNLEEHYLDKATAISHLDGISMEFGDMWRFNLRKSNTEPVVRLNVEAAGDEALMRARTEGNPQPHRIGFK